MIRRGELWGRVETPDRCQECGGALDHLPLGAITYLAPIPWGYLWQRPQQLTSRLAAIIPVLYVQPEALRNLSLGDLRRGLDRLRLHLHRASGQTPPPWLEVLAPPFFPLAGSSLVDRLNHALMARTILMALRHRHPPPSPTILWCTRATPGAYRLAKTRQHTLLVYELMDAVPATHPMARRLAEIEQALIRQAGLVICTSEPLMEHARRLNARPHLIPNGVDPDHFRQSTPKGDWQTLPLATLGGPIVGSHGTIGEWIDFSLLAFLADHFPEIQFVMVGPIEVSRTLLPQRKNLHWIGPVPYQDLPAYVSCFTICLLPLRVDDYTRARNPVKLFEYLATGKPVVSTDLPEVSAFGELVSVGKNRDELIKALTRALGEGGEVDAKTEERRAAVLANTWDQRAALILHHLHTSLAEPPAV